MNDEDPLDDAPPAGGTATSAAPRRIRLGGHDCEARLALGFAAWSLLNLPGDLMDYPPKVVDAGFETIEVSCLDIFVDWNLRLRDDLGLALVGSAQALTVEEVKPALDNAVRMGVVALNAHLGHGFMEVPEAVDLVGAVDDLVRSAGLLLTVETHRGRCTQDPVRTRRLAEELPDVRFNLDVSHWWVGCEGSGNDAEAFATCLSPVQERTVMIHGRVSDGNTIQADIGEHGDAACVDPFVEIWAAAMRAWRAEARSGDVFLFTPELGPPPYAPVGLDGKEVSDRWQRSLAMADLGRRAWARAVSG